MHLFLIEFLGSTEKSEGDRLLDLIVSVDRWGERVIDDAFEIRIFSKLYESWLFNRTKEVKLIELNNTVGFDESGKDGIALPDIHINFLPSKEYTNYLSLVSRFEDIHIIAI